MMAAASQSRQRGFAGPIWTVPLILAALTLFGLLAALLGQHGIWWVLSWIALTIPLLVIVRCVLRESPPRDLSNASLADE
jgi:hypothetical protein